MKHLLPPVKYYKANFHCHSVVSDGKLTPEELRDAYKEKGYSILAITDHSVMVQHQHLNQPDFLLLTGVEIDVEEEDNPVNVYDRKLHMCLIGKNPLRQWLPFRVPPRLRTGKDQRGHCRVQPPGLLCDLQSPLLVAGKLPRLCAPGRSLGYGVSQQRLHR